MTDLASKAKPYAIRSPVTVALAVLVIANQVLRYQLLLRVNINWDEFHYLSYIYDYLRPVALSMQQTFHVHLFSWLPTIAPNDEITQITTARVVIFILGLGTSILIYVVGRRFLSVEAALFAVLCFGSVSDVMVHGASFRPDPMLALLVLAAAWCAGATQRRAGGLIVAGLLLALALQLTPKTVFFLPSLAALLWWSRAGATPVRRRVSQVAILAVSVAGCWALLRLLHRSLVMTPAVTGEVSGLASAANKVFGTGVLFPQAAYLVRSLDQNPLVWILLGLGVVPALAAFKSTRPMPRAEALALIALALPLTTLAFYRNSFPYYFVPLLALGVILCGSTFDGLRGLRMARWLEVTLVWTLIVGVFGSGLAQYAKLTRDRQEGQRQVVETVHRMFPEPVPYLDRCSMISSFPKVGFFMSTWGFETYLHGDRRSLTEIVREHSPPFLLANIGALDLRVPESISALASRHLRPEDSRTLREHYIHHWGIIFVAGKSFEIDFDEIEEFSVLIAGIYTVEGTHEISLDGGPMAPGSTVRLDRGDHTLSAPLGARVTLRWGDDLYRPHWPPPRQPIFMGL